MQPKYASAFAQKRAKNLMDASLAYLSGPHAFFPIRIEKSPSMKGRYILIKLTMGMLNTSMIGKRYTQGKLHPKWLMTQILMDRWTGKGGESGGRYGGVLLFAKHKLFEKRRALHILPYFPKKSLDRRLVRCYYIPRGD